MYDVIAVVAPQNKDWILDRFAKEVIARCPKPSMISYNILTPKAKAYFFTHYTFLPAIVEDNTVLYFTHPSADIRRYVQQINACKYVVTANQAGIDHLVSNGVITDKVRMIPEASNPSMFRSQPRKKGNSKILISSRYYRRKNAELLNEVITSSPSWTFRVVGPDWPILITNNTNVEHYKAPNYEDYPELYSDCGVYLSCATLEGGGPNSLIEAMHSNIVPVVSDTGNAREYIFPGHNGFIFPTQGANVDLIKHYLERAFALETDISATVKDYTWENWTNEIIEYLSPTPTSVD